MRLDFFTRQKYIVDTLAPIWKKFPEAMRGRFYLGPQAFEYAAQVLGDDGLVLFEGASPEGDYPILTAAYGDMAKIARAGERKIVLMQHGIGHTFGTPAYANGGGRNDAVDLWLAPNGVVASKILDVRQARIEIVGSPKTDQFVHFRGWADHGVLQELSNGKETVIGFSCHWGARTMKPPELASAWEIYHPFLADLARRYKVLGHSHPITAAERKPIFERAGVEYVERWQDVVERADIYINDISSTLYEFLLTGKPVIVLNAPWYRRNVEHGIRFWEASDVGINVNYPDELIPAVERTIREYGTIHDEQRIRAINRLFPFAGSATDRAINVLVQFIEEQEKMKKRMIQSIKVVPADAGVIYMSFGEKAANLIRRSLDTLVRHSGSLPAVVIGDTKLDGVPFIPWRGESPFDSDQKVNFQFRAGRVKPYFYELSPFQRSLYLDADTEILQDIRGGFGYLNNYDFAVAQERHSILGLYNTEKGRWHHDMEEREKTIEEFGGIGHFPFINSGVFFWKKNERTQALFENWAREWLRFQQWDEQAALLRAINKTLVKVLVLSESWNFPIRDAPMRRRGDQSPVILHLYGRGRARTNHVQDK